MEKLLKDSTSNLLDPTINDKNIPLPGTGDVIFIPYVERMNASLAYYKGLCLRKEYKYIDKWFRALEKLDVYRGSQGDFHTHSHDLPPQMGGCWIDPNPQQEALSKLIDIGEGVDDQELSYFSSTEPSPESIALSRVLKHRKTILKINPIDESLFDQSLRAVLTNMITNKNCIPRRGTASGLRYLRDRISVPRDMPLLAARKFRQALEKTAQLDGPDQGNPIPYRNRLDQNPTPFLHEKLSS